MSWNGSLAAAVVVLTFATGDSPSPSQPSPAELAACEQSTVRVSELTPPSTSRQREKSALGHSNGHGMVIAMVIAKT